MSRGSLRRAAGVALLAIAGAVVANAASTPKTLSFVSCPIVRDTDVVPCWLADYRGQRYFLGITQDLQDPFFPPQHLHKALVEGEPTGEQKCGGIVLKNVKVSVMLDIDPACTQMLPAEGYRIDGVRRGTGPDTGETSANAQRASRVETQFSAPFEPKEFTVYFDFGDDYMPTRSTRVVTEAMRYATASKAKRIEITGRRGAARLSDGTLMKEESPVVDSRVAEIRDSLVDLGYEAANIRVSSRRDVEKATGYEDYRTRRVDIRVLP